MKTALLSFLFASVAFGCAQHVKYATEIPESSFTKEVPFFYDTSVNEVTQFGHEFRVTSIQKNPLPITRMKLPPKSKIAEQFYNFVKTKVNGQSRNPGAATIHIQPGGLENLISECFSLQMYFRHKNCGCESRFLKIAENLEILVFPVIDQLLQWTEHFLSIGGTSVAIRRKKRYSRSYDVQEDREQNQAYGKLAENMAAVMKRFSSSSQAAERRQIECNEIQKTEVALTEILKKKKELMDQLATVKQQTVKLGHEVDTAKNDYEAKAKKLRGEGNDLKISVGAQTDINTKLNNQIKTLKETEATLKQEKSNHESAVSRLRKKVTDLKAIVTEQESKKQEMNSKIRLNEKQQREYLTLTSNREKYTEEASKLTRDIAALEAEIEVKKREKPKKQQEYQALQMENDKLETELASARSKKENGDQEFLKLFSEVNRNVNLHQEAKYELEKLKKKIADIDDEKMQALRLLDTNRSAEINLKVLESEKFRLNEQLRVAQQENYQSRAVLSNLSQTQSEMKSKLVEAEEETRQTATLLGTKKAEMEVTSIKLRQADKEVAEMKRKLSSIFDYLADLPLENRWEIPPVLIVAVCFVFFSVLCIMILICIKAKPKNPSPLEGGVEAHSPGPSAPPAHPQQYYGYDDEEPYQPPFDHRPYNAASRGKPVMMH